MFPRTSVRHQTAAMQRRLVGMLPKKLQRLATFGFRAFVSTPFQSCNANARMADGSRHAAEMRMCRLLRHIRLASLLMCAVRAMLPLDRTSVLNIDFSNFGGVAVLVAALQTRRGRALPWALEGLVSNTQGYHAHKERHVRHKAAYREWKAETGGDQYDAVLRLVTAIDRQAATPPRLVFDRGFGNKRLLSAFFARTGTSYVRLRESFHLFVETPQTHRGHWLVGDLPTGDYHVRWLGLEFRLIIATTGTPRRQVAPWAIATNDHVTTPQQIATLYYHRFEIEETFRDWKSGLGLRRTRFQRWQSLQVALSFASVATLFAWQAAMHTAMTSQHIHPKKQLSFFRIWHESLVRPYRTLQAAALPGG